jgi:hypothetical protein
MQFKYWSERNVKNPWSYLSIDMTAKSETKYSRTQL